MNKSVRPPVRHLLLSALAALCLLGCTGRLLIPTDTVEKISDENFIVVNTAPGDTWSRLAQTYLGDKDKAWYIAGYNNQKSLDQPTRVVIPLIPVNLGGLTTKGYQTVPILMYTSISKNVSNNATISPSIFESHLKYMKENGYVTVSLDQLDQFLYFKDQLPPKAVIITFDTAQRWIYETALPLLRQYQFRAALFVPTGVIGSADALTWAELAQMAEAGFDIGTSGHSSQSLITNSKGLPTEEWLHAIEKEISDAGKAIKIHLKKPCRYFAYPDGETNDMLIAYLKQYGFTQAFTRKPGANPFFVDDFRLHRVLIDAKTDLDQFQRHLKVFQLADLK